MLFNDKTDTIFRRMMFGKSLSFLLFLGVITFCQTRVEMSPVKSPMLTTMTTETVAIPTTTKSPDLMGTITDILGGMLSPSPTKTPPKPEATSDNKETPKPLEKSKNLHFGFHSDAVMLAASLNT
ncbi:unnamed protein product [Trichobilharzia szidati]|nr:unnamed protein product [Trichobilharzia szidati]